MKFSDSLKKNRDFQNVYRKGKSYANRYFVMYVLKNETEQNRLGISVSKKVGNSVIRHHLTRLVREAYRLHEDMFNSGLDIVVIARGSAKDISYHQTESALLHLGGLHNIIVKNSEKKMESFWKKYWLLWLNFIESIFLRWKPRSVRIVQPARCMGWRLSRNMVRLRVVL